MWFGSNPGSGRQGLLDPLSRLPGWVMGYFFYFPHIKEEIEHG